MNNKDVSKDVSLLVAKEISLTEAKHILKKTNEFTDEQAEEAFKNAEKKSFKDVRALSIYLRMYRPELSKKMLAT